MVCLAYSALGSNLATQTKTKSETNLSLESKYNDLLSQVNKVTRQLESVRSEKRIDQRELKNARNVE